jgi:cell division transport system ATP-binding protein
MAFIDFRDVTKVYPTGTKALDNVSFSIEEGEFVFFIGESGAGKSTIFKLLTCEERPTSGEVLLDNFDIGQIKDRHIPFLRRKIGMVFQDFRLIESLTVGENVAFAMEIIGEPKRKIRQRVPLVLAVVGLRNKINDYPSELSGGEQQRVCIARALVNRPHLIIADEPTGDLDPVNGESIMALLDRINRNNGTTIVTCSHDSRLINRMNKRVLEIRDGVLIRDDARGQYFKRDERADRYVHDHEAVSASEWSEEEWAEGDHAMELLKRVDQQEREERLKKLDSKLSRHNESLQSEGFFEELRKNQAERRNRPGTKERREQLKKRLEETGVHKRLEAETLPHDAQSLREASQNENASAESVEAHEPSPERTTVNNVRVRTSTSPHFTNVIRKRSELRKMDESQGDRT